MARPSGGDWGLIGLAGFAAAHNVIAAGRRREMICGAFRRHAADHPLIVAGAVAGLIAHMYGRLGRYDPLWFVGTGLERAAEITHSWRAHRPQ